jgi:deazaflavin-dependent oxidoreductase (nitroreductase family)
MITDRYEPSPNEQIRDQVALYEATDGRQGGTLEGKPVVILTTVGARSGSIRKNPVMRITQGNIYVAVASNAGAVTDPAWYRNVVNHPDISVRDGATVHLVRAREVHDEEKARWSEIAERDWPHFPEYRASAGDREIPALLLEPRK